jgi:hypothetical protein
MTNSEEPRRTDVTCTEFLVERAAIASNLAHLHQQVAALAASVTARDPILAEMTTMALALAHAGAGGKTRHLRARRRQRRWRPRPRRRDAADT